MEWILYTANSRLRFHDAARIALDALIREYDVVEVRPPIRPGRSYWEVGVCASEHDPYCCSIQGVTLAEAAYKLAAWKGVEVRSQLL